MVGTDVGPDARNWAAECELNWDDLRYIDLTRAEYREVVLEGRRISARARESSACDSQQ